MVKLAVTLTAIGLIMIIAGLCTLWLIPLLVSKASGGIVTVTESVITCFETFALYLPLLGLLLVCAGVGAAIEAMRRDAKFECRNFWAPDNLICLAPIFYTVYFYRNNNFRGFIRKCYNGVYEKACGKIGCV